jgi:phospholipid/cholesterol/gamma-HCH transport system substrate-binding protein
MSAARNPQHKSRLSNFQWGVLFLIAAVAITYLGFTKAVPFKHHYEVKAVFKSANNLRTDSLVRIAGVNVGKVTKVEFKDPGSENAVVTMRIEKQGLPLHKDAQVALRERIFLEGNLFVDIKPGSPSAPELKDGDTIPVNQTSYPVQLDQVLTSLQRDTRDNLRVLLDQYSTALGGEGGKGFNRSIPYWEPAYKNSAIVNEATLGLTEGDLAGYIM